MSIIPDFTIEFHNNYLHVRHPPGYVINRESSVRFWMALIEACQTNQCSLVFREAKNVVRKMSTYNVLQTAELAAQKIPGLRVAIYFEGYEETGLSHFLEDAAYNRGIRIQFFSDREAAFRWLGVKEKRISSADD